MTRDTLGIWEARAERARQNRLDLPFTTETIDATRETFGPQCRLVWAREGDRMLGRKGPDGVPASPSWEHLQRKRRHVQ